MTPSGQNREHGKIDDRRPRLIVAVLSAFAALIAISCYLLFSAPPVPHQTLSPEVERDLTRNVEQRAKEFSKATQSPQRVSPKLEINETEANAFVHSSPKLQAKLRSEGISNPTVVFADGKLTASAEVEFRGAMIPVTVTGFLTSIDGNSISFLADTIKVGRVGVPRIVTQRIARKIDTLISSGRIALPHGVFGVQVENGRLILTGTPSR